MEQKLLFCLFVFLMLGNSILYSQQKVHSRLTEYNCFRKAIDEGKRSMSKKDFYNAFLQFNVAHTCDYEPGEDSIYLLINKVGKALNQARLDAIKDKRVAEQKTKEAIYLKEVAEKEKNQKERALKEKESAFKALKIHGRRSESMLLSILSHNERNEKRTKEALLLSFLGLQLADKDIYPNAMFAYGQSIRDAQTKTIFQQKSTIQNIILSHSKEKLLVFGENNLIIIDFKNIENPIFIKPHLKGVSNSIINEKKGLVAIWANDQDHVELWSITGKLHRIARGWNSSTNLASFSRNGANKILICYREEPASILYDLDYNTSDTLSGHTNIIYEVKFSPDGNHLLTRSLDQTVRTWDLNGKPVGVLGENEVYIHDATFNSKGNKIATASSTGLAKIWDLQGNILSTLNSHKSPPPPPPPPPPLKKSSSSRKTIG